ncbi:DUF6098 family protein [Jiangella asiatica]|uniref:Uncharacterized protein n=1 Tax=Jiangella asiatica TaxID=2530372 RepID=A0A4R5DRS8_9ACTN|nr:DUF6098 family protein [Jiangella asiatica]TDE13513.1 hypothetical protein E1269_05640 [Jiangella asiatica]
MAAEIPTIRTLDELTRAVRSHTDVFLRYSHGPDEDREAGASIDYESGARMPGLSVTTVQPEPWWPRAATDWVARRVCKYAELGAEEGRRPWLLTGRVVGHGPDHEPLVVDVEPLAFLADSVVRESEEHYRRHFDVARDSTD